MAPYLGNIIKRREQSGKMKVFLQFMNCTHENLYPEDIAGFLISGEQRRGIHGAWMLASKPVKQLLSTFVHATVLVSNFTVVVLVRSAAEQPASSSELQDL